MRSYGISLFHLWEENLLSLKALLFLDCPIHLWSKQIIANGKEVELKYTREEDVLACFLQTFQKITDCSSISLHWRNLRNMISHLAFEWQCGFPGCRSCKKFFFSISKIEWNIHLHWLLFASKKLTFPRGSLPLDKMRRIWTSDCDGGSTQSWSRELNWYS